MPARPAAIYILGLMLLAAPVFWLIRRSEFPDAWEKDLTVYSRAVGDFLAGNNPYNGSLAPMYFLYPPVFLHMAAWIARVLPANSGGAIYAVVSIAAICALPLLLSRYYFRFAWLSPLLAFFLFFCSPRFTGTLALVEMNIAGILYLLAFAGAVPGLKRNRWEWFYLAVFCAAMVKVTFLGLLLLPLLAGRRQWVKSGVCVVAVVAANLGEQALWPVLYHGYKWTLTQGVSNNYGYGIFGLLATYHRRMRTGAGVLPYAVFVPMAVALLALMLLLKKRLGRGYQENFASNGNWLALVIVAIILVNPREMQYDMDIALLGAFVLWVYALRTRQLLLLAVILFLPTLVVPLFVLNPHMHGMYETLLVFAAFGLAYRKMWREADIAPGTAVQPGFSANASELPA